MKTKTLGGKCLVFLSVLVFLNSCGKDVVPPTPTPTPEPVKVAPSAVAELSVSGLASSLVLTFTGSSFPGSVDKVNSTITGYDIMVNGVSRMTVASAGTVTLTGGLINGTKYTVTVVTKSSNGLSATSSGVDGTPMNAVLKALYNQGRAAFLVKYEAQDDVNGPFIDKTAVQVDDCDKKQKYYFGLNGVIKHIKGGENCTPLGDLDFSTKDADTTYLGLGTPIVLKCTITILNATTLQYTYAETGGSRLIRLTYTFEQ